MDNNGQELSRKRRRLSNEVEDESVTDSHKKMNHSALERPISPPPLRRAKQTQFPRVMPSPFQLTRIRDLPESSNVDAISLRDILGDPLIAECWEFNYLHDLDFLMDAFDQDVRDMVKVHVVHGFWKNEDQSRQALKVSACLCGYTVRYIDIDISDRRKPPSTQMSPFTLRTCRKCSVLTIPRYAILLVLSCLD
jgi:tyrosyl-DNA phosphodiesterase-1